MKKTSHHSNAGSALQKKTVTRGKTAFLLALLIGAVPAIDAGAQSAGAPAGFYRVDCLGNSDTIVSIPFNRPAEALALVESIVEVVEGDVTNGLVTVKGTPGWAVDQFVYAPVTQSNTYYLRLLSGDNEGAYYPVLVNGTNSLTIHLGGDNLTSVTNGTSVAVVPYWTMATAFPGGKGVIASSNPLIRKTEILIPDFTRAGMNLSPMAIYYYFVPVGSTNGTWRQVNWGTTNKNDDILLPDTYFTVRHNTSTNTVYTAQGSVPVSKLVVPLATRASGKQDNAVALTRPATVTLDESGLFESGAFVASPNPLNRADELYVFDNTTTNKNKSAAGIYYYYLGTWLRVEFRDDQHGERSGIHTRDRVHHQEEGDDEWRSEFLDKLRELLTDDRR